MTQKRVLPPGRVGGVVKGCVKCVVVVRRVFVFKLMVWFGDS
jgi:hypothetical protein